MKPSSFRFLLLNLILLVYFRVAFSQSEPQDCINGSRFVYIEQEVEAGEVEFQCEERSAKVAELKSQADLNFLKELITLKGDSETKLDLNIFIGNTMKLSACNHRIVWLTLYPRW